MAKDEATDEELEFFPLTRERWPHLENLFGKHGASSGCWCMWPRLASSEYRHGRGEENKRLFQGIVESGEEPGVLAYTGGRPVAWCAIAPREVYAHLSAPTYPLRRILAPVDDEPVWSVMCFYVRPRWRRRGITLPLLKAAVEFAAAHGARIVEGYPVDKPGGASFMGQVKTFRLAGFVEVARRSPTRPIFRLFVERPP